MKVNVIANVCSCYQQNLETLLLLHFCSEGNNISEGIIIASAANLVVEVLPTGEEQKQPQQWRPPPSWAGMQ